MYLSSKKIFSVVDSWHARSTAHRVLEEPWIGVIQFLRLGQFRNVKSLPFRTANPMLLISLHAAIEIGSSVGGFGKFLTLALV